jgi:hypothetical protein
MKHNLILQDAMSPKHERKSGTGDRESLPLFNCPAVLLAPQSMHHSSFLILFLHKSWDKISFQGGGCNTLCYESLNYLH